VQAAKLLEMAWIGIGTGPAAGQVRRCNIAPTPFITLDASGNVASIRFQIIGYPIRPAPSVGDAIYMFSGTTGSAEGFVRDRMDPGASATNYHRLGGNDAAMAVPNLNINFPIGMASQLLARTLATELGHTLGLGHGGRDADCAYHGDEHWSLMSYSHQLRLNGSAPFQVGGPDCAVPQSPVSPFARVDRCDRSGSVWCGPSPRAPTPMGFNANGSMLVWRHGACPGIRATVCSNIAALRCANDESPAEMYLEHGQLDTAAPRLRTWELPRAAPLRASAGTLTVEFTASDNVGVTTVSASF